MPLDQTQVIAGRNMLAYTQAWRYNNTFPNDTCLWGDPQPLGSQTPGGPGWAETGQPWVNLGFTRDGLRFRMNVERQDILVDQVVDPVLRIPTRRNLNLETALAQINANNLSRATGQGQILTTAAHEDYIVSGSIIDQYYSTGFDILAPGTNLPVRIVGWKGLSMADVEMQFNVTDAARIAYNIAIIPDTGTPANPINPPRLATFRVLLV